MMNSNIEKMFSMLQNIPDRGPLIEDESVAYIHDIVAGQLCETVDEVDFLRFTFDDIDKYLDVCSRVYLTQRNLNKVLEKIFCTDPRTSRSKGGKAIEI